MLNFIVGLDHSLFFLINGAGTHFLDDIFGALSSLASWPIFLVAAASLAETGRRQLWRHVSALLVVLGVFAILNAIVFHGVDRYRPTLKFEQEIQQGAVTVRLVEARNPQHKSFPSGHSFMAFYCMAYVGFYKKSYRFWALLLAGLCALSRVYVGVHFPSDCVAGALLGTGAAWLAWRLFLAFNPPSAGAVATGVA